MQGNDILLAESNMAWVALFYVIFGWLDFGARWSWVIILYLLFISYIE